MLQQNTTGNGAVGVNAANGDNSADGTNSPAGFVNGVNDNVC